MSCHTPSCDGPAWVRVHWPTKPVDVCPDCAERLQRVANAMGVHVHTEVLPAFGEWVASLRAQVLDQMPSKRHAQLELD